MRVLFWILLLGNVALFAVMLRWGGGEPAYQPLPALQGEKIRLLDANHGAPEKAMPDSVRAAAVAPVPLAATASVAAPVASALPAPAAHPVEPDNPAPATRPAAVGSQAAVAKPVNAPAKQSNPICLEWGEFSDADLKRAAGVLAALQLGDKLSRHQIEYDKGYWVYIPPLKNKAAAHRKISQLKARGVHDNFIVWDAGPMQYAISLGVFKTQDAALNFLKELRAKDIRSARVGERASKLKTTMFVLNGVEASTEGELSAKQKDFPGVALRNVPCALTK